MQIRLAATFAVALTALSSVASADKIAAQKTLVDLYKIKDTSVFDNKNSSVLSVFTNEWGAPQARVKFNGFRSTIGQDFSTAQDWSAYNILHFILINKEARTINLKLIVQFRADLEDLSGAINTEFELKPYQTLRICAYMKQDDPWPLRIEHLFPVLSQTYRPLYPSSATRDYKKVYAWRINNEDSVANTVEILGPRLIRQSLDPTKIVDKWGQYTDRTWVNKVTSDTQFQALKAAELTDLSANPGPGEQLGTTKVLNPAPVPGKWATVTASNGRKYLQHPNGRLFWAFGLNTILDVQHTPVEGREHYFTSLQSTGSSRFGGLYSDQKTKDGTLLSYSHRTQNLMIKYGDSYKTPWLDMVRKRLSSWGINTVGIDSTGSLLDNKLPYTIVLRTNDFSTKLAVPKAIWGAMPDPYHADYRIFIYNKFKSDLAEHNGRSNFMGVFVDNELGWGDLTSLNSRYNVALGALTAPSTQPAKTAFKSQLQSKYSSISSLNSAWKSSFSSWDAFMSNRTWKPSSYNSALETDFRTFVTNFAKTYFGAVRAALGNAGLKALYMGCRFANYITEAVNASTAFVDVHSFNAYRFKDKIEWSYFSALNKPVIFSELGYSVMGSGTMGGIGTVITQAERVERMKQVMDNAILNPNIVGVLWYCYQDQPVTGRYTDYENAGLGVVDIADTPYSEVVTFFRNFTKTMYNVRASSGGGGGPNSAWMP